MGRMARVAAVLVALACMACTSGTAWAQYVTPAGQTPNAGSTDTNSGPATPVNNNTQVLGTQFTRGGTHGTDGSNGGSGGIADFLASTGVEIIGAALIGALCLGFGFFLWRRSRDSEDDTVTA